jgi:succinoglycan biosynthesis transport protein ExoP
MVVHDRALEPSSSRDSAEVATYIALPRGAGGSYTHTEDGPDLYHLAAILWRRRILIVSCGLAALLFAIAYCALTPSRYTADAILELRGYAPVLSTIQSETLFGNDTRKIEYQKTTVAKLKLEGLADSVLDRNNIALDLERYWREDRGTAARLRSLFKAYIPATSSASTNTPATQSDLHFKHPRRMIQKYLSLIDIEPVHETNLVHIRATTTNKKLSQKIANTHAIQFIDHVRQERQDSIQSNVLLLQAQASGLKERVTEAENQLNAYAAQHKLLLVRNNEATALNNRHIDQLTQMLADATGRRIKSESALTHARKNREDEGSFLDTEIVNQLRANLKQAETEYATLGTQVTAAYPGMRELYAKIVSLKRGIRDERMQGVQTLQRQFDADLATENSLRQQIDREKSQAQEVAQKLIQYEVLSKEATSLRDLYQAVLKQAKEVEMSAAVATSNIFVADYAGLPTIPSAPKTKIIIIIVTFVGFAVGILAAYIVESLQDTISSPDEVHQTLNLPIIGSVPAFAQAPSVMKKLGSSLGAIPLPDAGNPDDSDETATPNQANSSRAIVALSAPHSAIAEALRTIRANVLLSSADYPPRVIMMTSSIQGEGKTTMLANLAVTLAQAGHRTLMIDGDLRMAGLSELFRDLTTDHPEGLSDLLARQLPLEQTIHKTPVPSLDILPAGAKAPNPAELVGSETMKRLLSGLKDRYDFILIDSPPVMAVADALLLSRMVDSVLFVVRSTVTPRSVARDARQKLVHVRARIIGVILNDVSSASYAQEALRYGANYLNVVDGSSGH